MADTRALGLLANSHGNVLPPDRQEARAEHARRTVQLVQASNLPSQSSTPGRYRDRSIEYARHLLAKGIAAKSRGGGVRSPGSRGLLISKSMLKPRKSSRGPGATADEEAAVQSDAGGTHTKRLQKVDEQHEPSPTEADEEKSSATGRGVKRAQPNGRRLGSWVALD